MDDEIIDVSANRKACGPSTQGDQDFLPKDQHPPKSCGPRMPLGFRPSCLYVAIADRAIGFQMPPDIPANELKK
ncbi:hypothetical protein LB577_16370 [Mesorhizobium sp. B283B1A]|uniref:hypothetical protein n=1 Tax=Mesorhizobium TaxID=68287 RepID=UPI001CD08A14|nr:MULTISPECIES: hypothetical protein [Mesorhizobium]MCA0048501.1 hypothetical protein [Mesorhizobium sp. B283B1A]UQS64069.1 hypothetical protein M5D98_28855 [Mesorhizobium opportunistum]